MSGSQIEITNFREAFEKGEDPLADTTDASDINSVAGVLKLYLRELREPLFPIIYFDHFVSLAREYSAREEEGPTCPEMSPPDLVVASDPLTPRVLSSNALLSFRFLPLSLTYLVTDCRTRIEA